MSHEIDRFYPDHPVQEEYKDGVYVLPGRIVGDYTKIGNNIKLYKEEGNNMEVNNKTINGLVGECADKAELILKRVRLLNDRLVVGKSLESATGNTEGGNVPSIKDELINTDNTLEEALKVLDLLVQELDK